MEEISAVEEVRALFQQHFSQQALAVSQAPGRVNLIGEHTDYNDGFVLPAALHLVTAVAMAPSSSDSFRLVSAQRDGIIQIDEQQQQPEPGHWANYVWGVIQIICPDIQPLDIAVVGRVPLGSGLSSSAALEVATAYALCQITGALPDPVEIAKQCQRAEHQYAGVPCGIMDQFISANAREATALLLDCRSLETRYVAIPDNAVLVIANSNVHHELSDGEYAKRRASCENAAQVLGVKSLRDVPDVESLQSLAEQELLLRRARHVVSENARSLEFVQVLESGDLDRAGELMLESHRSLQFDYEVSCVELDILVDIANEYNGCYGARMTGGGFGGCIVCLVSPDAVEGLVMTLRSQYMAQLGIETNCIVTKPSEGAYIVN